ncbi:SDR family NAD(P)-dependent oxidoreductase [Streptomyces sp. NPDC086519]|uniref:SDR family NAD(P)-dependent oxidoreductase n=1 Tax=Streptomyces sp. NPDC086519 TaxID=3154863 RepID=UPI003420A768
MTGPRVALVTGGARGLGAEIGRQLAQRGLRVLVSARNAEDAKRAADRLGPDALPLTLDVTSPRSVEAAVLRALGMTGRVDVLVNNAGIGIDGGQRAVGVDYRIVRETLETNLLGAWRVADAVIPHMVTAGYGRIVNLASNLGSLSLMTRGEQPAYRVSKAALSALTRILAADLDGTGVLVNAASPGWVRTTMGGPEAPRSVEQGADTPVWLATLPDGDKTTGGLFHERRALPW